MREMVPAVEELGFSPVFDSSNPLTLCYRISVPILFSDEDLKDDERSEIGVSSRKAQQARIHERALICDSTLPLIAHVFLPLDSGHFLCSLFHPSIWEVKFKRAC